MAGKGRWSDHSIELLRRYYGRRPATWIAEQLGRTVECVHRQATKQFRSRLLEWDASDDTLVREGLMRRVTRLEVARRLVVSHEELDRRIEALRTLAQERELNPEHEEDFKRYYPSVLDPDLVAIFGITRPNIDAAANRLQLRKSKGLLAPLGIQTNMPRWTPSELEMLRCEYPMRSNVDLARLLGRSVKSVVSKAHHMGLQKSQDRLRAMGAENVRKRYDRA